MMLPTAFDVRKQWPRCAPRINKVRDQGPCGTCWGVAVAAMVSDRLCIRQLNARHLIQLGPFEMSTADLMTCSGAEEKEGM